MTFGLEHLGKAYRTKSVNVSFVAGENYERSEHDTKDKKVSSFNRINSTFFEKEVTSVKKGEIVTGYNRSLK